MNGVEIVLTDRVTRVSGTLLNDRREPLRDATVVVFPSSRDAWFEGARGVTATSPDQEGRWVKALPPGEITSRMAPGTPPDLRRAEV